MDSSASDIPSKTAPSIAVERTGATLVARPQGKLLDDEAHNALTRAVEEASRADAAITHVVVDLSAVTILPSLALGLLVRMADQCGARSQKLTLAALQPQVRRVFAITRLDRVFQIAPTVEAALG
jgi:anti-anti-sigma factor